MNAAAADLVVLGGGPAGLAAAASAAEAGLLVQLIDEQSGLGGQIYRNVERATASTGALLGADYRAGLVLVERFRRSGAEALTGCTTWSVAPGFEIGISRGGTASLLRGRMLVVATGAMERPVPFDGWTLPGVMTAGAAQILLKAEATVPAGRIVLAGLGPLLDLVALQLSRAGADVAALIELMPPGNRRRAAGQAGGALLAPRQTGKGLARRHALRRAGVPRRRGIRLLRAEAGRQARLSVTWETAHGVETAGADWLLVHQGVIPNIQVSAALRCRHSWDERQRCWRPERSERLESSAENAFIAGDGGGIIGAAGAALEGEIAGLEVARRLGAPAEARIAKLLVQRDRTLRTRPFIDALFAPSAAQRLPDEDGVIVCRCEETTVGDISRLAAHGVRSVDQAKFFSRAGMGACQGRQCGVTVTELLARECGTSAAAVGHFRVRPPLKPITLGELAQVARAPDTADVFRT